MYRKKENVLNNCSTPKRRRLGVGKIRPSQLLKENKVASINTHKKFTNTKIVTTQEGCESPIPCNQIEYLSKSGYNSSTPCSPKVSECSVLSENVENWESLVLTRDTINNIEKVEDTASEGAAEITIDIFNDRCNLNPEKELSENSHTDDSPEQDIIEGSFNESIFNKSEPKLKSDISTLFETMDSFIVDIKDSPVTGNNPKNNSILKANALLDNNCNRVKYEESFYGLPVQTKDLFKNFRNIDKFYDWQEECLNLESLRDRQNLIYALPTSGGKTLVAEVLMLKEVLNRKKNVLFVLPFVAIVQEKIWSLSPFAVQLDFLVEEYAGGKGHIPPKKRRKKNTIYVATIEKGLGLVRSLIELKRLNEIGLVVVDELHLIGEPGRGGTLETLLSTILFADQSIQIVGMSATIGNLSELAQYLRAHVYERDFRPVELTEYVKLGNALYRIVWGPGTMDLVTDRQLFYDYSPAALTLDPDYLGGLVSEVVPEGACLVFCPTKRSCENVAALLCKMQRKKMLSHRSAERETLSAALRGEGARELSRSVRCGVGWHHAGLAGDERALLEHAYRSGVISVLCCTSTLAAGVNLPARRVLVRAPLVGRAPLTLAAYRQMVGRAGRAGITENGESIIICSAREWSQFESVLRGGLAPARSTLAPSAPGLLLSAASLGLATTRARLTAALDTTLMAIQTEHDGSKLNIKSVCDSALRSLFSCGALGVVSKEPQNAEEPHTTYSGTSCNVHDDSELVVIKFGRAAIKSCLDIDTAKRLLQELEKALNEMNVGDTLYLLYLVTPHDAAAVRPDYRHYYSLYRSLDERGINTARILGLTEVNAIKMMTGKQITNVSENVLARFYLALMLYDLWNQLPIPVVADKYCVPRGTVQTVMTSSAAFASSCQKFCEEMDHLWTFRLLMGELAVRLRHCAAPELHQLMELPAVKKGRALQLLRAGYKRVEDVARASPQDLAAAVSHLSRAAATHLISAARMMLIEKVENLRAEAEDVMDELNT